MLGLLRAYPTVSWGLTGVVWGLTGSELGVVRGLTGGELGVTTDLREKRATAGGEGAYVAAVVAPSADHRGVGCVDELCGVVWGGVVCCDVVWCGGGVVMVV